MKDNNGQNLNTTICIYKGMGSTMDDVPTFLKWAGGKRRLIKQLEPLFPKKFDRYYEPFLGGGYIFFYLRMNYPEVECHISDVNEDLIHVFKAVRDNPKRLIMHLKKFKSQNSKEFYYKVRDEYNRKRIQKIKRAAAFIYMNKNCFNGLYRVNMKNEFNVPYGTYKNPEIFNIPTIMHASKLLQGVEIQLRDYRDIAGEIQIGDFVYLDPCYDPLTRESFVSYTPDKFCEQDRINLYNFINFLDTKGAKVLLSNNRVPEVNKLYSEFEIHKIKAPRYINSVGSKRGRIIELAIRN